MPPPISRITSASGTKISTAHRVTSTPRACGLCVLGAVTRQCRTAFAESHRTSQPAGHPPPASVHPVQPSSARRACHRRPRLGLPAAKASDGAFRVELETSGLFAMAEGLIGRDRAEGQMHRAFGNGKGVEMRLRHVPRFAQEVSALGRGRNRASAALVLPAGQRPDLGPKSTGNLLRTLTDAQKRNVLCHEGANPVSRIIKEGGSVQAIDIERTAINHRSRHAPITHGCAGADRGCGHRGRRIDHGAKPQIKRPCPRVRRSVPICADRHGPLGLHRRKGGILCGGSCWQLLRLALIMSLPTSHFGSRSQPVK